MPVVGEPTTPASIGKEVETVLYSQYWLDGIIVKLIFLGLRLNSAVFKTMVS